MILKFISSLNENQKKLLAVAVILVAAALFDRLLIGPTMSKLSSINQDIVKEENDIRQDMHFLGYKTRIMHESREIAPYLTKAFTNDDEMIAAFLKEIETLAGQANVTLVKVSPASGEQDADYWKYQADLECTGKLADIVSFMHAVNTSKGLLKVSQFNFTAKNTATDDIKATMTIVKIVVPSKAMPPKPAPTAQPTQSPAGS